MTIANVQSIFLWIALLFIAGSQMIPFKPDESVRVGVGSEECMVVIFQDGYASLCPHVDQFITLNQLARHLEFCVMIYNKNTKRLVNVQNFFRSKDSMKISNPTVALAVLWPGDGEIISSTSLDIQYNFEAITSTVNPEYVCSQVLLAHTSSHMHHRSYYNCSNAKESNSLRFEFLHHGSYHAKLFVVNSLLGELEDITRMFSEHIQGMNPELIQPKTAITFSIIAHAANVNKRRITQPVILARPYGKIIDFQYPEKMVHILMISCRSVNRYKEAEVSIKSLLYSRRGLGHSPSRPIDMTMKNFLVLHMVVDAEGREYFQKLWLEKKLYLLENFQMVIHDFDRVCGEPLIEFLQRINMRQSSHHSGKAGYCRLFLPSYFADLHRPSDVSGSEAPDNPPHDQDEDQNFRANMLSTGDSLLKTPFSEPLPATTQARARARATAREEEEEEYLFHKRILSPDRIITLETDQLILADIESLWAYFDMFDNDTLIAAPENYQPWADSRPMSEEEEKEREESASEMKNNNNITDCNTVTDLNPGNCSSSSLSRSVLQLGGYHGFGIICGVMLLRLDVMRIGDLWTKVLYDSMDTYRHKRNRKRIWEAKLNDQDIFNVVLTLHPKLFMILPCEWNIQFHARLNSFLSCSHHVFSRNSTGEGVSDGEKDEEAGSLPHLDTVAYFLSHFHTADDVPLNCEKSIKKKIFVCDVRAKILHFMGRSYDGNYGFLRYYENFWETYAALSWGIVSQS